MSTIETIRKSSEIWEALQAMPDEAIVRADRAAIYLGVSKKTLARLRQNGDGPPYIQVVAEGSDARNQIVNYPMGELRAYRKSKLVTSTIHAAELRGMTFSTINDLLEEQPYWQTIIYRDSRVGMGRAAKSYPYIIGHLLTVSDNDFLSLFHDENAEVVWMSLQDVLNERWIDAESRAPFHRAYTELLQGWIEQSNAKQEAAELMSRGGSPNIF